MKDTRHARRAFGSLVLVLATAAGAQAMDPMYAPAARPGPAPAPSPARAVPTFESIGLYWTPNSTLASPGCTAQFRKTGDAAWRDGLTMWYDKRNKECRGSLVGLTPDTNYEVRIGLPGQAPSQLLTVRTWSENFPIAGVVTLPPGTSQLTQVITQGGTPTTGYMLYTTDPNTPTVIDGENAQSYNVVVAAPYVIVRGLVLKGAQQDAIRIMDSAHDVVIENNDVSGWGRSSGTTSKAGYVIGVNEDSGVHAVCSNTNLVRVVVQRNRIHDPRYGSNSWSEGHPNGPQGITFATCGGNHVLRYNELYSTPGHYFNDGIGGAENFSTAGFPNDDSDIYGNRIENAWDDCIEAEGGDMNTRVWGNYCNNTTTGVASTIVSVGPLYIFRNVYNRSRQLELAPLDQDDRNVFAKSGTLAQFGAGRRYLFHNTLLQAAQDGAVFGLGAGGGISGTGPKQLIQNTVSRNNIYQTWKATAAAIVQSGAGNDYGWDLYNGPAGATETNGIQGTPLYAAGNGWTSEAGGMYQQDPASPGYHKGVRIPNFNDDFPAPDIGAHQAGTPAMAFGVNGGL